jgi:hypothetical protein
VFDRIAAPETEVSSVTHSIRRLLPAVAVVILLAAALLAPRAAQTARPLPQTGYLIYPGCAPIQEESGTTPVQLTMGEALIQPLGDVGNVARCTLAVTPSGFVGARAELVSWDSATLAPDPTTLALRSINFTVTDRVYPKYTWDLFPQVITRVLPQVAEPPRATTAMRYQVIGYDGTLTFAYAANGDPAIPAAYRTPAAGPTAPLGAPHAVADHAICGGDEFLQSLHVVQSVMTATSPLPSSNVEYIQKFRVPVASTLRWAEFCLAPVVPEGILNAGRFRIVDAEGQAEPPVTFEAALADAPFYSSYPAGWSSHVDLTAFPVLEANHDYWFVLTTHRDYALYTKPLSGAESPYFTTAIGPLFERGSNGAAATLAPNRALSFRLIGIPEGTVGVEPARPARGAFELSVSPNPSRGGARLAWSGARGDVAIDVMDARGRRVASGSAPGTAARWAWNGAGDDGHALPAGIYFARARDGAGRVASARVTLVH